MSDGNATTLRKNSNNTRDLISSLSSASVDSLKLKKSDADIIHEDQDRMNSLPLVNSLLILSHSHQTTRHVEEALSLLAFGDDSTEELEVDIEFDHTQCLFCKYGSKSLDDNLDHMLKQHGLFIPDKSHLIVDIGTLAEYLHLVIFVYFECLFCGSQRRSAEAAQQHMIGKGHCKINIQSEDSEFREFYDFDSASELNDVETFKSGRGTNVTIADQTMRLPSGKVVSHRAEGKQHLHQYRTISTNAQDTLSSSQSTALGITTFPVDTVSGRPGPSESKRIIKRESIFNSQLAKLRAADRRSLMYLSRSQQRAVISKARKQTEQARRDENDMLLKIQLKANR